MSNSTKKFREEAQRQHDEMIDQSVWMWKTTELRPRSYYVVEIAWRSTNAKHRVIMITGADSKDRVEFYSSGYESPEKAWLATLHSFQVITPIDEMNKKK
jgi:hypothetical protein